MLQYIRGNGKRMRLRRIHLRHAKFSAHDTSEKETKEANLDKDMRILVISDTHRRHDTLERVLEVEKKLDYVLHLGDVEGSEDYIEFLCPCPVEMVAGNNDFFSRLPGEKIITIGNYKILMTHGHYYYVAAGLDRLKREAEDKEVDIVMYGHTHYPLIEEYGDITIINPGSLTHPRQPGRTPSYIMMEIEKNGKVHFEIKYIDTETL